MGSVLGWVSSIPGLFSALWNAIKLFFTFELGEYYQSIKDRSDELEEENKKLRDVLNTGNDVYKLSESEIVSKLNGRGLLRDVQDLPPKSKP